MRNGQQIETEALIRDILASDYAALKSTKLHFDEDFTTERVTVQCEVTDDTGRQVINGEGVGLIDAFFSGMQAHFAKRYPSLKSIVFADFSVKIDLSTKKAKAGSDAHAHVELTVENAEGKRFGFQHASRSVTHSSVEVVGAACAYFVNSERAFLKIREALEHAQREKRHDSIQRYTAILAQLVENTSYSEAIQKNR